MRRHQIKQICETKRLGYACAFMNKKFGCTFNNQICYSPIINNCKNNLENCKHITTEYSEYECCDAYLNPDIIWKYYVVCPLATHVKKAIEQEKPTLDPRKAAKQRRRKG